MPVNNVNRNSASDVLRQLGKTSEKAGEAGAKGLGTLAKAAVDVATTNVKEGVLVAGSTWVAYHSFDEAIKAIQGHDVVGPLKPQSSGTDQAIAIGVFTAAGLVASGIAVKNAFEIAANLIDAAKKG